MYLGIFLQMLDAGRYMYEHDKFLNEQKLSYDRKKKVILFCYKLR